MPYYQIYSQKHGYTVTLYICLHHKAGLDIWQKCHGPLNSIVLLLQSSSIMITVTLLGETIMTSSASAPSGGKRVMMKDSIPSPDLSVRS